MKITFVGHASILIETQSLRILSDPWWSGPCFGAQWWVQPPAETDDVYAAPLDYIYISHGHHDHLHSGTLRTLNREATVLVSDTLDLRPGIEKLGYTVREVGSDEVVDLGNGVSARLTPTHGGDTLFVVDDGSEVCANLNDAVHPLPRDLQERFVGWLKEHYARIDYCFMGYGTASHFPNCYRVPGKDDYATAAKRQAHFNRTWARLIHQIGPKLAFPFAASLAFFEDDLFAFNAPVHNPDRPTRQFLEHYPDDPVRVIDASHGFVIESGEVKVERLHVDFDEAQVRATRADHIKRANRYGRVSDAQIDEAAELLQANLDLCRDYLAELKRDYRFLFRFRNTEQGFVLDKRGDRFAFRIQREGLDAIDDYDVCLTTRLPYLRLALTEQYGDENLFVGSGCLFDYRDRETAFTNLHRELMVLVRYHEQAPPSRFGDQSRAMHKVKTSVRKLLGIDYKDIYDLRDWLVFKEQVND